MIVVIGAGIVGAATAANLTRSGHDVTVVDQEIAAACHQSGRNSGVVHSGIYYPAGSLKSEMTAAGRAQLRHYARDRQLPWLDVPKLVVATEKHELEGLRALEERARENSIPVERLGRQGIADAEPGVEGRSALRISTTAITDFAAVTRALLDDVVKGGGHVRFAARVVAVSPEGGVVLVGEDASETVNADRVVACAGLGTIGLARSAGVDTDLTMVPFRGAYWQIDRHFSHLVYPVPDPRFPFLGAHFTPALDGCTHIGPTATLALGAGTDGRFDRDLGHLWRLTREPGLRRLARSHWRDGLGEWVRSTWRRALVARCRRLLPDLDPKELRPGPSGVRAQALRGDGELVDDFEIVADDRCVYVLNAPSPAATASLEIGARIAGRLGNH